MDEAKLNDKIKDLVEKNEKLKDEAKQSRKAHDELKIRLKDAEERAGFAQHRLQNSMGIWKLMLPLIAHTATDPTLARKVIEVHQAIDEDVPVDQKSLYDCGMRRISMLLERDTTIAKTIMALVGCPINQQAYTRQGFAR